MNNVKRLLSNDSGQGTTEYAFLLILIAIAAIETTGILGSTINKFFEDFASNFP